MDFSYTEEQSALRDTRSASARGTIQRRVPQGVRRGRVKRTTGRCGPRWPQAGILGTAIDVRAWRLGPGADGTCLVLEEQGRTLAAVPLLATLVLGALPLQRFGNAAQQALLPQVAAGDVVLTAALEEEGATDPLEPTTFARRIAGGWRLSGVKTFVPYALQAQFLLVSARTETQGASLFLLPQTAPGLTVEPQRSHER